MFYYRPFRVFLQIGLGFCLMLPAVLAAQENRRPAPEQATGVQAKEPAAGERFMAVTANPHATRAAYAILKKGGNAIDAAIAAQLVLGLVEPQSSGLGGGAFALYYDADNKKLHSYDGRETAPSLAGPFHFYENGEPMDFEQARLGGRAVGVPGLPLLLEQIHERHGKLTWMELFDGAIALAESGFAVSPRLAALVESHKEDLSRFPATKAYFLHAGGRPVQTGEILKNPAYAETLRDMAFYRTKLFYHGQMAARISETVQNIADNPGLLTPYDFENYEVRERKPVCGPYRAYIVCAMGEPSSGGLTLLQMLGILEGFDLAAAGPDSPQSWHLIAEASRLAFADRASYMADPDFVNTPGIALLDPVYIRQRAALIDANKAMEEAEAGNPPLWAGPLYERGESIDKPGTTHISIIDADGNAVSITSSIESAFGSHVMVGGFLLNNQLTDFSFTPFADPADQGGGLVANMVEHGKRPRSSMTPVIVFNQNEEPVLVVGSAGGSRIIGYVLQRIIAVLDWGMDIQNALAMPHILARGREIEMEKENRTLQEGLAARGHRVTIGDMNSGLTAIIRKDKKFIGAADPRREGMAMGD